MADYPGIGFLLNDIARLMRLSIERKSGPTGLTRAQWAALAHLNRRDGIKQAELAALLEVDPVTVTRVVDRLVTLGLVVRGRNPDDRRVHLLSLTAAAAPCLKRMDEIAHEMRVEALDGVDAGEVAAFVNTAERIRANLSKSRTEYAERNRTTVN